MCVSMDKCLQAAITIHFLKNHLPETHEVLFTKIFSVAEHLQDAALYDGNLVWICLAFHDST